MNKSISWQLKKNEKNVIEFKIKKDRKISPVSITFIRNYNKGEIKCI